MRLKYNSDLNTFNSLRGLYKLINWSTIQPVWENIHTITMTSLPVLGIDNT
jgi:hypothetical protein